MYVLIYVFIYLFIPEFTTEDKLEYQFNPVSSGALHFKVRAAHDAHIALTPGPTEGEPMYEVSTCSFYLNSNQQPIITSAMGGSPGDVGEVLAT